MRPGRSASFLGPVIAGPLQYGQVCIGMFGRLGDEYRVYIKYTMPTSVAECNVYGWPRRRFLSLEVVNRSAVAVRLSLEVL